MLNVIFDELINNYNFILGLILTRFNMKYVYLIFYCFIVFLINSQTKTFTVNFSTNNGKFKDFAGVNCGAQNNVAGYKDMKIKTVRTHDYYGPTDYWNYTKGYVTSPTTNTGTAIFSPTFNPHVIASYSFTASDAKIDNLINNGFTPYFRLGVSFPSTTPPYTPVNPPIDANNTTFHTFASICKRTVMHYTEGWNGNRFDSIPYWEVWNEPEGDFWEGVNGTPANFFQMYKEVADSIKTYKPTLKVGACGALMQSVILHKKTYFDSLFIFCKNNNVPLDFYSWHMYSRYNPYSIKNHADTVQHVLSVNGFTNTESHISEVNTDLNPMNVTYDQSVKGTAYAASMLMTCQEAYVHKVFWYRGETFKPLANADANGQPNLTYTGLGFKKHNILVNETPIKLITSGNEVINFNSNRDTTNLMIIAGKNNDDTQTDILISNLKTNYSNLVVNVTNLPYSVNDVLQIEKYTTQGASQLALTTTTLSGANTLSLSIASAVAPSVYLIKIKKLISTHISEIKNNEYLNVFPNPTSSKTTVAINNTYNNEKLSLFNIFGEKIDRPELQNLQQGLNYLEISLGDLPNGFYFLHSVNNGITKILKHQ